MTKRTKALEFTKKTKDCIWERDHQCCILCGNPEAMPNAHIIARSQGGKGVEENGVTLCLRCHQDYDNTDKRGAIREKIIRYIKGFYPGWSPEQVIYSKYPKGYGLEARS